jgi:hypothetical protein
MHLLVFHLIPEIFLLGTSCCFEECVASDYCPNLHTSEFLELYSRKPGVGRKIGRNSKTGYNTREQSLLHISWFHGRPVHT